MSALNQKRTPAQNFIYRAPGGEANLSSSAPPWAWLHCTAPVITNRTGTRRQRRWSDLFRVLQRKAPWFQGSCSKIFACDPLSLIMSLSLLLPFVTPHKNREHTFFSLETYFSSTAVAPKLLLISCEEFVLWNILYGTFHFPLFSSFFFSSIWDWHWVCWEHVSVVAFECCKVNAEDDSLNGIIKADVSIIWMLLKSPMPSNSVFIFSPDACTFLKRADNLLFLTFPPFSSLNLGMMFISSSYNSFARKFLQISPKQRHVATVIMIHNYSF